MGFHGLMKAHHGITKQYAIRDWKRTCEYARQHGRDDLIERHEPDWDRYGTKRIDRCTRKLLDALGVYGPDIGVNVLPDEASHLGS